MRRNQWMACVTGLLIFSSVALADQRQSVSQWDITWTFDKPAQVGQFVTGDWWVVGPVTITAIDPAPAEGRHGSVINPVSGGQQAYDDRMHGYNASQRISLPVTLQPGDSLVTAASVDKVGERTPDTVRPQYLRGPLRTAAVLTCVAEAPPANAFRPGYVGTHKKMYTTDDLKLDMLPKLERVDGVPNAAGFERSLQRIWLDHQSQWVNRMMHPIENMPDYGRDITNITGTVGLMLLIEDVRENNPTLLHRYVQLGIDYHATTQSHKNLWMGNGGHNSGRLLPVLFAAVALNDPAMQKIDAVFSEVDQTYHGPGYAGQKALFTIAKGNPNAKHEEVAPDQWETFGKGANNGSKAEGYRKLNGPTWVAAGLAGRLMGTMDMVNHAPYFDYVDRWMAEEGSSSDFVKQMWAKYRDQADAIGQQMIAKREQQP